MTIKLIDKLVGFEEPNELGKTLVVRHTQEIPDDWVADLKREKVDSLHTPAGDFYRVGTIPTVIVEKWMREGFNLLTDKNITARDVIRRLQNEHLDAFVTTTKRI